MGRGGTAYIPVMRPSDHATESASAADAAGRCVGCGYARRGLRPGVACPECGMAPAGGRRPTDSEDPLLQGLDDAGRRRVQRGLRLITAVLLVAGLTPAVRWIGATVIAIAGGGATGFGPGMAVIEAVAIGLWFAGVLLALPPAFWDEAGEPDFSAWPGLRWRSRALAGTAVWGLAAAAGAALDLGGATLDGAWATLRLVVEAAAGLAGLAAAWVLLRKLARVAARAELSPADDRLATAAWFGVPLAAALGLMPATITWLGLILLLVLLLVPWTAILLRAALGSAAMVGHLAWADRIGEQAAGREDRIAARRAELDAGVRASIRPLPGERPR
jgi:hypothetical protein